MKKTVIDVTVVIGIFILINCAVKWFWIHNAPEHCRKIDNSGIHTVVVGASTTEVSINDRILSSYVNLSEGSLWYTANYGSVEWANEYNPISVDTVICASSLIYFLYYTSGCSLESPVFINASAKYSILHYAEFVKIFKWKFIKALTKGVLIKPSDFKKYLGGQYLVNHRNKLDDPRSDDKIRQYQDKYGRYGFTEEVLRRDAIEQVYFLRKIKQYCDEHHIVFVLFQTPLYHITDYVDDSGYRNFILHEFGENQLIADYQNFNFPDNSYYADMEHVNEKGSIYLSEEIMHNGLKLITAKENCMRSSYNGL